MGFSPPVFTMWRILLFLSFKNVFSLSLSWNPVWVPTSPRERSNLIIFIHFHIYINTLTLSTSNYRFNWYYLLGVNQEESVYKNKEHLKLYSYNVEKQLNRAYHAFFKKGPREVALPLSGILQFFWANFFFLVSLPSHFSSEGHDE